MKEGDQAALRAGPGCWELLPSFLWQFQCVPSEGHEGNELVLLDLEHRGDVPMPSFCTKGVESAAMQAGSSAVAKCFQACAGVRAAERWIGLPKSCRHLHPLDFPRPGWIRPRATRGELSAGPASGGGHLRPLPAFTSTAVVNPRDCLIEILPWEAGVRSPSFPCLH